MTSGPWSVKGIDPKAREIAKDLARRSGLTLGEWLNQMILDGDGESALPGSASTQALSSAFSPSEAARINAAIENLAARLEAAETRSTVAISHIDQSVRAAVSRIDAVERQEGLAPRLEGALSVVREEQGRTDARLARIERDNANRIDALKGIESALIRFKPADTGAAVTERLEAAEARTRAALDDLRASLGGLDRRLVETEGRTAFAADGSAAALDHTDLKLERLARDLGDRVEALREDMLERLQHAAGVGRLDLLEDAINQVSVQVDDAEKSSAQAIDRMSREMLRVAEGINQRIAEVETRDDGISEKLGAEVARVAQAVETRLARADVAQSEALQRLSGEIARVADRLNERLEKTDARLSDVADETVRQNRVQQEQARMLSEGLSTDLAERIRQSEARTAKWLEEAQTRFEAALARREAHKENTPFGDESPFLAAAAPASRALHPDDAALPFADDDGPLQLGQPSEAPPMAPTGSITRFAALQTPAAPRIQEPAPAPAAADVKPDSFNALLQSPADDLLADFPEAFPQSFGHSPFEPETHGPSDAAMQAPAAEKEPEGDHNPFLEPDFDDDDFHAEQHGRSSPPVTGSVETARDFGGASEVGHDLPSSAHPHDDPFADAFVELQDEPFSDLDAASEPAPQADRHDHRMAAETALPTLDELEGGPMSTRDLIAQARNAARAGREAKGDKPAKAGRGLFGLASRKKDTGVTTIAALLAVGLVGAGAVTAVGYKLANDGAAGPQVTAEAPTAAPHNATAPAPEGDAGQLAVATAANPAAGVSADQGSAPAAAQNPAEARTLYEESARGVDAGDPTAVKSLIRAAEMGYPQAQFHLSALYEKGAPGLDKDAEKSRQWVERAANAGLPKAMYNLALDTYYGRGGAIDLPAAAEWFRRAANAGVTNAQYNLAKLYENGYGVPENFSQAYIWYLIAAHAGDKDAAADAARIKASLNPSLRSAAEQVASSFKPQTTDSQALASR